MVETTEARQVCRAASTVLSPGLDFDVKQCGEYTREDFGEILSRVFAALFHIEIQLREQQRRSSTTDLFCLSRLNHLLTNAAQRQESQLGSATTV